MKEQGFDIAPLSLGALFGPAGLAGESRASWPTPAGRRHTARPMFVSPGTLFSPRTIMAMRHAGEQPRTGCRREKRRLLSTLGLLK